MSPAMCGQPFGQSNSKVRNKRLPMPAEVLGLDMRELTSIVRGTGQ